MATVEPNEELTGEDKHYQDLVDAGLVKPEEDAPQAPVEAVASEPVAALPDTQAAPQSPDTPAEAAAAEEFFPGYANLPEASQALVRQQMERAERAQELESRLRHVEQDHSALKGRVAPAQRELEAARARLKEIEQSRSTSTRAETKAKLDKFLKQYPEEADAILAVNGDLEALAEQSQKEKAELLERFNSLENSLRLQQQEFESTRALEQARATLKAAHPDYEEISADPTWKRWLDAVDPIKKKLFQENRQNAEVMASLLYDYKRDRDYARQLDLQNAGTAPEKTPATKPLARSVADPNPTARRATAIPRSNSTAGLTGEDLHVANLQAAGYDV